MAHWVPGFLVVIAIRQTLVNDYPLVYKSFIGSDDSGGAIAILSVVVVAFIVGEVLDASRDLLEHAWDLLQPLNWNLLFSGDKEKVENLKASYFTYYAFDCNTSLALAIIILVLHFFTSVPAWGLAVPAVFLAILAVNAFSLRREIAKKFLDETS